MHLTRNVTYLTNDVSRHQRANVSLIREVELGLDARADADQRSPPLLHLVGEVPLELSQGLPALRGCFGIDEIGDALRLRQIEFPVEKGAAGKLARLGWPETE